MTPRPAAPTRSQPAAARTGPGGRTPLALDEGEGEDGPGVAAWLPWASVVVSVAGVAVAAYLTVAHFTTTALLACPESATVNCAKVTTSPESVIVGIPVAVLGLAYFCAMVALNLPAAWRAGGPAGAWLARLRLAGVVVGIAFALYLVSAELLVIGAICIYCSAAHLLAFALFVLVAAGTAQRGLST